MTVSQPFTCFIASTCFSSLSHRYLANNSPLIHVCFSEPRMQTSFQRRLHSHLAFSIPLVPVSHQAGVLRKRRYSKLSPFHHHHRLVFLTCMRAGPTNSTPEILSSPAPFDFHSIFRRYPPTICHITESYCHVLLRTTPHPELSASPPHSTD